MKIKAFNKDFIPTPVEKEIFLKFDEDYASKSVSVIIVSAQGVPVSAPFVLSFGVDHETGKMTFSRTGGVNIELVQTSGPHNAIKEVG